MAEKKKFFKAIIESIFGSSDNLESVKKRALKSIIKNLKRTKYNKLYRVRLNELDVSMAKMFYTVYRQLGPLHKIFNNTNFEKNIKNYLIQYYMSDDAKNYLESISEEEVKKLSYTMDSKKLVKEFQSRYNKLRTCLVKENQENINMQYKAFLTFSHLIKYDYFYLLKKFDPRFPELDFVYKPNFSPIIGAMALDELKDFHSIIDNINSKADWQNIFEMINEYKQNPLISDDAYKKVIKQLDDLRKSNALEYIISIIDEDPSYTNSTYITAPNIIKEFLEKTSTNLQKSLRVNLAQKKEGQIQVISKKIFGKVPVNRMRNYSEKLNVHVVQKGTTGFLYHGALNYIKNFISDVYEKQLKETINIYIVQGKWNTGSVNPAMSDAFYKIKDIDEEIQELDESLAEDKKVGASLRNYLRADNNRSNPTVMIDRIVLGVNQEAEVILKESISSFVKMDQILKKILEDYETKGNIYITNWKELESYKEDILQATKLAYNKIYNFLQLMQLYKTK